MLKRARVFEQGVLRRMEDEVGLGQSSVCSVSFSACWLSRQHHTDVS